MKLIGGVEIIHLDGVLGNYLEYVIMKA